MRKACLSIRKRYIFTLKIMEFINEKNNCTAAVTTALQLLLLMLLLQPPQAIMLHLWTDTIRYYLHNQTQDSPPGCAIMAQQVRPQNMSYKLVSCMRKRMWNTPTIFTEKSAGVKTVKQKYWLRIQNLSLTQWWLLKKANSPKKSQRTPRRRQPFVTP